MSSIQSAPWESLEQRSPTLFLVGGGLLVGHAVITGLRAFTEVSPPPDAFGPAGLFLVFTGLIGLYPALVDRSPWLAWTVALLAVVPAVDYALILLFGFGELVGIVPRFLELVPDALFFPVHQGSMILAYGFAGPAILWTDACPRQVGVLLLAPPVLMFTMVAGTVITPYDATLGFFSGCGMALVHLAIGYSLGAGRTRADRLDPTGDGTTG